MAEARLEPVRMRIARPSRDLVAAIAFYVDVVGLERLGGFEGHAGYDGVFVGPPGGAWHVELTRHDSGEPAPSPTDEDLLVLYLDHDQLARVVSRLDAAGHLPRTHPNPYWSAAGAAVFADPDGYLLVLCPVEAGTGASA